MGLRLGAPLGRAATVRQVVGHDLGGRSMEVAVPVGAVLGPVGVSPLLWSVEAGLVGGEGKLARAAAVAAHSTLIRSLLAAGRDALAGTS